MENCNVEDCNVEDCNVEDCNVEDCNYVTPQSEDMARYSVRVEVLIGRVNMLYDQSQSRKGLSLKETAQLVESADELDDLITGTFLEVLSSLRTSFAYNLALRKKEGEVDK